MKARRLREADRAWTAGPPSRLLEKSKGVIGAMSKVLIFAAVLEVVTGLALLIAPSLVGQRRAKAGG